MDNYITIGKEKISLQALVILFWGFLLILVLLCFSPVLGMAGLILVIPVLMQSYNVNCAIHGHCKAWAWILTFCWTVYVLIALFWIFVLARYHKIELLKDILNGKLKMSDLREQLKAATAVASPTLTV